MAVWSETKLNKVLLANRIDGEYYLPEYIENEAILNKTNSVSIPKFFQVSDGNHMSVAKYFLKDSLGVPYFRGQDINSFYLSNARPVQIPEFIYNKTVMHRSHFKENDVLLSIVGTIGSLSIVPENYGPATGSCKIAILRAKGNIDPYYLSIFLLTKYGQLQIKQNTRGAVQMGLILEDIVRLRVPFLNPELQNEISELAKNSLKQNQLSQSLYTQAQNLLESELGLDKLKFDKPRSYEAMLSEVVGKIRGDAEFHNPLLKEYYKYLSTKHELERITEYSTVIKFGNPDYAEVGIPIITQKHLQDLTPSGYGVDLLADNNWVKKNPTAILRKYDLLFYSVGAYLGKTNIWLNEDKAVPASFITMLRCNKEIDVGYLMILLNSKYGILQSKVFQSGTSQQYIYPKDIRHFLVPKISNSPKRELLNLIIKSHNSKTESQNLLEQAKRRVEELIEAAVRK